MYDMGNAKIYHGDARHMDSIADGSIHMVITSPPYLNARDYSQWNNYQEYLADMTLAWKECYRVLCDGGRIAVNVPLGYGRQNNGRDGYMCIGDDTTHALKEIGFAMRGHIIWVKSSGLSSTAWGSWRSASDPCLRDAHEVIIVAHKGKSKREKGESTIDKDTFKRATTSVWQITPVQGWHPAPFPDEIPHRLIQLYTFKGDTVLDPFAGSMTTPFTAAREGRIGIGVELNLDYLKQACGTMFVREDD
jgi:site-specific DNA-methyltransferase (adenine-specific)